MNRRRDVALTIAVGLAIALYPLIRLWRLPKTMRLWLVEYRLIDRFTEYDAIVRVRWFMREVHTVASGSEADSYFELDLADGRTVAVSDTFDRTMERTLAALELLPARPTSLGDDGSALAWMMWFPIALVVALVAGLAC